LGDALGGQNRSRLEENMEAVDLEAIDWEACAMEADTLFIG
jgi:hypothetical protein